MTPKETDHSPNQSDSDDWTLVSPPHSSSSSPNLEEADTVISLDDTPPGSNPDTSNSNLTSESIGLDGLTEIDLNSAEADLKRKRNVAFVTPSEIGGFQPLDSTTDDDEKSSNSSKESRRSSLTQSELGEYVDLGKNTNNGEANALGDLGELVIASKDQATTLANSTKSLDSQADITNNRGQDENINVKSIKARLDRLSDETPARDLDNQYIPIRGERIPLKALLKLMVVCSFIHFGINYLVCWNLNNGTCLKSYQNPSQHQPQRFSEKHWSKSRESLPKDMDFGKSIPSSQQRAELELLHSELSQCIKRQSPSSYKYYMSEDRFKDPDDKQSKLNKNLKSQRGLVCYGQEAQWRKRFDRLKAEYGLDLRQLMQDAKRRISNEMLESNHPSLQSKLILNQIEYLDFIENRRIKKQSEEMIKYLKAENLQLLRRLNHPNETGYQKLVVSLELENNKLQRENEALKKNLGQKAGTTFIKQSLELEQYERENIILKQFHHQVVQDVFKSLRQFNVHTIDASTILDDHETLNSQLMLTRGYLRRLGEKISTVLLENEGLKEELKEIYLMNVVNGGINNHDSNKANLPAINNEAEAYNVRSSSNNNSNALTTDTCIRNVVELKEKNQLLEEELARLRKDCSRQSGNVGLERCSERHLNRTGSSDESYRRMWQQLGSLNTAMDKHAKDSISSNQDDILDELIIFLTKFNNQIESNGLAVVEQQQQQPETSGFLAGSKQPDKESRTLPNYIQEAVRKDLGRSSHIEDETNVYDEFEAPSKPPTMFPSTRNLETAAQGSEELFSSNENESDMSQQSAPQQNASLESQNLNLNPSIAPAARNSWFFKRAKQRKQLRKNKSVESSQADWMMKRASLREKLRKASLYIETNDIVRAINHDLKCNRRLQSSTKKINQKYDCKRRRKDRQNKQKKPYQQDKRNKAKYFKDEL